MADLAVRVRGAVKQFGSSSRRVTILDNLDMSVPKGCIYALLGASGCGKTTLLNCVVGQMKLNAGDIYVLGGKPGAAGSGVPGPKVGFMPQELALMPLFTVKETIFYFGWLFGMDKEQLQERYRYLSKLLQLPRGNSLVKYLSGGQQRRVSIAAALVHEAELLILDEPTVGLDPVLRDLIWQHLVSMTSDHKTTIIITTHYIEEARQAHVVGLARLGRLLTEDSPEKLLIRYKCPSLEAVFLKLSVHQSEGRSLIEPSESEADPTITTMVVKDTPQEVLEDSLHVLVSNEPTQERKFNSRGYLMFLYRIKPLLFKSLLGILRSPGELIQAFIMPVAILILFFFTIGRYPPDLKLAVVNEELGNYNDCDEFVSYEYAGVTQLNEDRCQLSGVSCIFLSMLNDSIATKVYYNDQDAGLDAVNTGNANGLLHFPANYSRELQSREEQGRYTPPSTVEGSELQVFMSKHDLQVYYMLQMRLHDVFLSMADRLAAECNMSFRAASIPLKFHEPVYGEERPSLQSYAAPRAVITIVFMVGTTITSATIVGDRISGIWNRNIVAGVTLAEILISHLFFQMSLALLYSAETLSVMFLMFGEKCKGDIFTMFVLVYLQAVCGVSLGLVISVISKDYIVATFMTIGSFIPILCFVGLIWPIEGMYFLLKYLSLAMPTTISTLSLNHIIQRGWSILRPGVYGGFLITFGWIAAFILFSILLLRIRGW